MNACRVWNLPIPLSQLALALACATWSAGGIAQGTSPGGARTAAPQVRPAAVSGQIGTDPTAVALHPVSSQTAHAPLATPQRVSTAVQVPPPANPNEPLLPPSAAADTPPQHQQPPVNEGATAQPRQHADRTQGVKKPRKTEPQKLEGKTTGKPRQVGKRGVAHDKEGPGRKKNEKAALANAKPSHHEHVSASRSQTGMKRGVMPAQRHGQSSATKTGTLGAARDVSVTRAPRHAAATRQQHAAATASHAGHPKRHAMASPQQASSKFSKQPLHKKPGPSAGKPRHPAPGKVMA